MHSPADCRIAMVDLTDGSAQTWTADSSLRRRCLGGRGVNVALLLEHCPAGVDPLDPANPLIVGVGPLVGLPCPSPARTQLTAKSPESGLLADSNIGGFFGPTMRRAGFDHVVVRGQADQPAYLLIEGGRVSIRSAADLWGLDTVACEQRLQAAHGAKAQVLCIGPAGENLVRFACVRHGLKSAAGKGGLGCLMGAKRLKAIVAEPGGSLPVADRQGLLSLTRALNQRLGASRTTETLREYGTAFLFALHNYGGYVRTRNGQSSRFARGARIAPMRLAKSYTGRSACFGCRIGCRHQYVRPDGAPGEGVEYSTVGLFGPNCGVDDPNAIFAANDLCNDLGLDVSATGSIIGWVMECAEKGLVDAAGAEGSDLRFGDAQAMLQLIRDIALRRGFGDVLADGMREAAACFGPEAEALCVWSKRSSQTDPVDVRAFRGFALGVAVSTRGADHLRGRPTLEALMLSPERLRDFYGGDISPDPRSCLGKALMVFTAENEYALGDAAGICRFAQRFNSPDHVSPEELRQLVALATGLAFTPEAFMEIGERMLIHERLFVAREAGGAVPDGLPPLYFKPVADGPLAGVRLDADEFQSMLKEYYALRGCDPDTGAPTLATLRRLGTLHEDTA